MTKPFPLISAYPNTTSSWTCSKTFLTEANVGSEPESSKTSDEGGLPYFSRNLLLEVGSAAREGSGEGSYHDVWSDLDVIAWYTLCISWLDRSIDIERGGRWKVEQQQRQQRQQLSSQPSLFSSQQHLHIKLSPTMSSSSRSSEPRCVTTTQLAALHHLGLVPPSVFREAGILDEEDEYEYEDVEHRHGGWQLD